MVRNIGVIGAGRMGRIHCRVLSRLGHLTAVCDVASLQNLQLDPKVALYSSLDKMLTEHPEINGIVIATPTSSHAPIAETIIKQYGQVKSILIEKPLADTIEAAERLRKLVNANKIRVTVGHIEVYNPVVQRMLQMIKDDLIGTVRSIIFQRRGAVSDGRLESIGDVFQDIGIHDFDIATRFFPPGKYSFFVGGVVAHHEIVNSATALLSGKGLTCTFLLSREYAGKMRRIELEGEKATMIVDLLDQFIEVRQLGIMSGDLKSITVPYGSGERIKVYGEPLLEECWNFLDTLDGRPPLVTVDDGIRAMVLVEAARRSYSTRNIVEVEIPKHS